MTELASKVLRSSAAVFVIKASHRSIGLISTLILARVLTPDDFGLVAIVSLVVHLFDILATAGSTQYIIQKNGVTERDLNTAWSIDLILKTSIQILLISLSPFVSDYYDKPELQWAITVASFSLPISAMVNPGLLLLKKNLDFSKILKLSIFQKVFSFCIVMTVIAIHPSYWALIAGDIAASFFFTVGSYRVHLFRPRFSLAELREQFNFSQWVVLKSIFGYARSQADTVIASSLFSMANLGSYHLIKNLISLPIRDIVGPVLEPLLAAFAATKVENRDLLPAQIRVSISIIFFVITPITVFTWSYSQIIVDFILGSKWNNAEPILAAMSLLLLPYSLNKILEICCISVGLVRQIFIYDVVSTISIVGFLIIFSAETISEFSFRFSLLNIGFSIVFLIYVDRLIALGIFRLVKVLVPILFSGLFAKFLVDYTFESTPDLLFLQLLYFLTLYLFTYILVFVGIYFLLLRKNHDVIMITNFLFSTIKKLSIRKN
ncbi:polysaccharide transporter [Marinobacter sp. Z-F4-2]|nr:polysaccharide transporter [Marinobacter sp. Z-F4-2]